MVTKTETIPDYVRTYIHAITSALKRALETGDFTI